MQHWGQISQVSLLKGLKFLFMYSSCMHMYMHVHGPQFA